MNDYRDYHETDVLVIGCGIAGGVTALQLADAGRAVTVITRAPRPQESNTYYAQGGIIYQGETDSPRLLVEDIVRAGAGLSRLDSVETLAQEGPALVEQILLERVGVPFDQNGRGLSLAREGGHSLPRIIHAADATGKAIALALVAALAQHPRVTLLTDYTAVDLRLSGSEPSRCQGTTLLEQASGRLVEVGAGQTVLATGGLGQLFARSTNPAGARGDGVAMAYRAGARVSHMEFVQFHPTTFSQPGSPPFLISEAVRGAGARLVDGRGEPFMQKYAPEWRDLAPRDVVARSIHQEMQERGVPHVYLDLRSYMEADAIRARFPTIYDHCRAYGVDISQDLIPIAPAAHYACGGVTVDSWGQSSLPGLWAVGEVSCTGLHGANRLASTSLLEGLVWGYRAARRIEQQGRRPVEAEPAGRLEREPVDPVIPDEGLLARDMRAIQHIMWARVGLVRESAGLSRARAELTRLQQQIEQRYQSSRPSDALVGLRNAAQVARLIATAAEANERSVGCHYRLPESVSIPEPVPALMP